ncbi:MAG: ABC transporter permease subunit [Alphaproteobacteria bacterium]|nr:ABC transporter permease subunit [Alphaproteobacteria bacterium]
MTAPSPVHGSGAAGATLAAPKVPPWRNPRVRAIAYQIVALFVVLLVAGLLVRNTLQNLEERRIRTGFAFVGQEAGFEVAESLIEFSAADSYGRAFVVGILNTLKVAVVGIVLATIVGFLVGIGRLSRNWIVSRLSTIYVEAIRNVPLLLQLFLWYSILTGILPDTQSVKDSPLLPGVYLSKSGLQMAIPIAHPIQPWVMLAAALGAVAAWFWGRRADRVQAATGNRPPVLLPALGFVVLPAVAVWLIGGAPYGWDVPRWRIFNFGGGVQLSPEYLALLVGLTVYTASFIAEIVRAGILAVAKGQSEAAGALGLTRGQALRLVIVPQSLRVAIPPLSSQYLNLTKNSSLAVAIGYPDLVSVANTTLNQTGQAIECVAIMMAVYLTISLSIAAFMNWYNTRMMLKER